MSKYKIIKPHFRTHKINGHPSYIYAENTTDYKYIGITHAEVTHGLKNVDLKFNPETGKTDKSRAISFSTHDKKTNFKKRKLKGFKIHKADKKTIAKIKKNYRK